MARPSKSAPVKGRLLVPVEGVGSCRVDTTAGAGVFELAPTIGVLTHVGCVIDPVDVQSAPAVPDAMAREATANPDTTISRLAT